jgi:hypothetical protein
MEKLCVLGKSEAAGGFAAYKTCSFPKRQGMNEGDAGMTERNIKIDRLSNNYEELDIEGKETLLKIGEMVFTVYNFVNKEISSLTGSKDEMNFEAGNDR